MNTPTRNKTASRLTARTAAMKTNSSAMKSRSASLRLILAGSVAALLAAPSAKAAIYYWDDNAAGAGFGTAGANTGTWDAPTTGPTAGWSLSATGANAFTGFSTGTGDTLNFGNAANGTNLLGGTITVGTVSAGDITFASGSGAIVLSGGTITLAAAQTTTVNNTTDTINSILAGAATSFTKAGTGTLILTGANTYTGTTIINRGTLQVGDGTTGSLNGTTGTALNFTGTGTINFNEAASSNQGMGLLTLTAGQGTVQSTFVGTSATLTFTNVTARSAGASVNFFQSGGVNGSTNSIILTQYAGANTVAGALIDRGVFFNGANYATANAASGFLRAYGAGDTNYLAAPTAATIGASTSTSNVDLTTGNITAQTTASANTINMRNFSIVQTGATTLSTNGILSSGSASAAISGASLTSISAGGEIVMRVNGASDILTISSAITNNAANTLTKSGDGTLILTVANAYTGATRIGSGTLQLGNGVAGAAQSTGSIIIAAGGNLAFNNSNSGASMFAFGNVISGAGSVTLNAGNISGLSGSNTYSGGFTLNGGYLSTGTNAATIGTGTLTLNGGTLSTSTSGGAGQTLTTTNANIWSGNFGLDSRVTGGSMVWNNNGNVLITNSSRTVTGTVSPNLNLGGVISDGGNNYGLTFNGMTSVSMSGVNTYTGGTTIGAGSFTISGSGSLGSGNYAGAISNAASFTYSSSADQILSGALTGAATLVKSTNTSTLTLSGAGANTYSLGTTVTAGTLLLNKSGAVNAIAGGGLTIGAANNTAATVQYTGASSDMMGAGTVTINGRGILDFNGKTDTIGNVAIVSTGAGANTTPITNTNGGGNLTIGTLGITPATGFTSVANAGTGTITLGGDVTFTAAGTGQAQITGTALALGAANRIFTVGRGFGATQDLLVDAQITGARLLTKAGVGRMTITAPAHTLGTTVSAGTLLLSGANNMPTAGTLAVSVTGMFSLADGTARNTTGATSGVGLTLAAGSYLGFDWNAGSLDNFTTAGTATSVAGNVVLDIRSVSPSGTGGTLITAAAGSTLNTATYLLANNTNFTATINKTATSVSLSAPTFATLTDAYWRGNQVTGFTGTMTVSTGTLSNWASDAAGTASGLTPGSTTNMIFGATGAAQQANVITGLSDMSVNSITFNDSLAVTIAGSPNTITLNSTSGTAATTSGDLATVTAGSAISVTSFANATNTISANLLLGANQTWNVASGKTLAVSGIVSGTGSLTKADTGTVTLSGANTYTGGTTISAGTLKVGNATALGANSSTVSVTSGAVLDLNATAMTGTNALTLNGSGIGGTGAMIGNGNSTYAGAITLGSASTIGNSSGTLNLSGITNLNGNALTLDGAGSFSLDFAGNNITGAGGLIKSGAGQLIVNSGQNQSFAGFTGNITLNGGSIGWQNGTNFFAGKNTLITGGYLGARFNSSVSWASGLGTGANQIQITGGTSGFSSEGSSGSTFTIGTSLSTLVWGASGQGAATGFFNPTVLLLNGTDRMNANGNGVFANGIDLNGATRTITSTQTTDNAAGSGMAITGVISNSSATASGLTKTGVGNLRLNGANTFNGVTTLSGGYITLNNALALQNSVYDTTASIAGSATAGLRTTVTTLTLGGLSGNKDFSTTGVFTTATGGYGSVTALTLNPNAGFSPSYAGIIANGAAGMTLTKTGAGTQTLTNSSTYTGATAVNAGTLVLGFGGVATNILPSGSALTLGGGTLQITGTGTQTVAGLTTTASTSSNILLGANETLTLGALTAAGAGSSLNFNTAAGGAAGATVGTGIITLTGGTLLSTFTVTDSTGFGLATRNGSNQIIRNTATTLLPASGALLATDYLVDNNAGGGAAAGSSTLAVTASESAKSITVDTTAASGVLTLNSTVVLSNSIWNFGGTGTNTYQITNAGGAAAGTGLRTGATAETFTINNYNTGTVTFTSPILAFGVNPLTVNGTGTTRLAATASTYTGATKITGGTLEVTRIATNTAASSIGTPGSVTAPFLLLGNGTTLRFVGDGSGNDTTDRNWTLNGTSDGDSATIDASGAGTETVTFSTTTSPAYGTTNQTRTINLAGTNTGDNTLAAVIANNGTGAVSLTKSGSGTWLLTGTNSSYTGATTISDGTLNANTLANGGSNSSIGASTNAAANLVIAGGTLRHDAANVASTNRLFTIGGTTGDTASLISSASGSNTLSFTNTGAIAFGNTNAHTLTLGGTNTGSNTFTPIIGDNTGATSLVKSGTNGMWILTGSNTYSGATTINAGVLQANHNSALGTTAGATTVDSGAELQLGNGVTITGETLNIAGGGLAANLIGALRTATGANAEWAGTVNLGASTRLGAAAGTTLTVSGAVNGSQPLLISGASGTGTVLLTSTSNGYTGATQIIRGILKIGATNALPTGTILDVDFSTASEDSTFDLNGFDQTVAGLQRTGAGGAGGSIVTNTGGSTKTLTVNQSSTTSYNGIIQGNLALTKSGAGILTLSGTNTYAGKTIIQNGTLSFSVGNVSATADQQLGKNTDLDLGLLSTSAGTLLYTGGTGTLAKNVNALSALNNTIENNGGGTLTLSGTLAKNGTTLVLKNTNAGSQMIVSSAITGANANSDMVFDGGTTTLNAVSTYNGPTTIQNSGTVKLGIADALPTTTALSLLTSGIFDLAGFNQAIASLAGNSATAKVTNSGSGADRTLEITGAATTVYDGFIEDGTSTTALKFTGTGFLTMNGNSTYSGGTIVRAGTLTGTGTNSSLGVTTGTLEVSNVNTGAATAVVLNLSTTAATTTGSLSGTIAAASPASPVNTATINNGGQTYSVNQTAAGTFAGNIAGAGGFTLGSSSTNTLTLSGTNGYTGTTTVNAGTLEVTGSLSGTTAVNVNSGGTLLLNSTSNDIVNTAATVSAGGGTLAFGNGGNQIQNLGNLTLSGNSVLDFGTSGGNDSFYFGTGSYSSGSLNIVNWGGNVAGTATDGTADRLLFAGDATAATAFSTAFAGSISFDGNAGFGTVQWGSNFEIVPVPEPATTALIGAVALCALIGYRERRRFSRKSGADSAA